MKLATPKNTHKSSKMSVLQQIVRFKNKTTIKVTSGAIFLNSFCSEYVCHLMHTYTQIFQYFLFSLLEVGLYNILLHRLVQILKP